MHVPSAAWRLARWELLMLCSRRCCDRCFAIGGARQPAIVSCSSKVCAWALLMWSICLRVESRCHRYITGGLAEKPTQPHGLLVWLA